MNERNVSVEVKHSPAVVDVWIKDVCGSGHSGLVCAVEMRYLRSEVSRCYSESNYCIDEIWFEYVCN